MPNVSRVVAMVNICKAINQSISLMVSVLVDIKNNQGLLFRPSFS